MAFWAGGRANYRTQLKAGKRRVGGETTTVRLIRIILTAAWRLTSLIDRLLREVADSFITALTSLRSRLSSALPGFGWWETSRASGAMVPAPQRDQSETLDLVRRLLKPCSCVVWCFLLHSTVTLFPGSMASRSVLLANFPERREIHSCTVGLQSVHSRKESLGEVTNGGVGSGGARQRSPTRLAAVSSPRGLLTGTNQEGRFEQEARTTSWKSVLFHYWDD